MPEVILTGPRVINGAVRYPAEGPIPVTDEEYDRLAEAGVIEAGEEEEEDDGLEALKLDELKKVLVDEGVDVGTATKKDDIIAVIRAHRALAG